MLLFVYRVYSFGICYILTVCMWNDKRVVVMKKWERVLNEIYFNPKHPSAFAGPIKVYRTLLKKHVRVTLPQVEEWVQNQDAYSLLRPVRYRFLRQRIVTSGLDDMWDADLAEVGNISQHNGGVRFWLVVIDVFSRYLWVIPTKTKSQKDMVDAFKALLHNTTRRPQVLRTDNGKEFVNQSVRRLFNEAGVKHFTTKNETKANYAERVIRTLKGLVYRYCVHNQTYTYDTVLQDLVHNYNHRPHSSLKGRAPADIIQANEAKVWKEMYVDTVVKQRSKPFRFKLGDTVRISHMKYTFQRDYHQKWTQELFVVVARRRKGIHRMYKLADQLQEEVQGLFYEAELQKVKKADNALYHVEKILNRRKRQGREEVFVKWVGHPAKFNQWIWAKDLKELPSRK